MEPRGSELVSRYKTNYSIPADAPVTEEMVLAHWDLEKRLTRRLLESKPETRWQTFDDCYTQLYEQFAWLNELTGADQKSSPDEKYGKWLRAIGSAPKSIYEVGSGKAEMISYFASRGYFCRATEVTRERGEKHVKDSVPNLTWAVSDGVHLGEFEQAGSFDVVISDQVLEHLHPDDVVLHLRGVLEILKPNGRYVFSTPHRYTGPHDVSAVFKYEEACGMHLREYTNREFVSMLKAAGVGSVSYAFIAADGETAKRVLGRAYLNLLMAAELGLSLVPTIRARRLAAKVLKRLALFSSGISLIAVKN
jgi:SAM-dependent methyltransferase